MATLDVYVKQGGTRVVLFELSRYLQVKQVEYEGKPLEFIQNEAIEGSELSRRGNDTIAVVFPAPLQAGSAFCLALQLCRLGALRCGRRTALRGRSRYLVSQSRHRHGQLRSYFSLSAALVAGCYWQAGLAGAQDGSDFIGHWISEQPIPIAGFNLGEYVRSSAKAGDIEVDAYAARGAESQRASPSAANTSPQLLSPHAPGTLEPVPDAAAACRIRRALDNRWLTAPRETLAALSQMLGPYPFSTLSLTENPSPESQGWPGLIFLSSYAYLQPEQLQAMNLSPADAIIYSEVMMPHELAHQWYGDHVSWASYHEQWLLEALANYCSLLLLERSRPADVQLTLENYRQILASQVERRPPHRGSWPGNARQSACRRRTFPMATKSSPMAAEPG